MLADQLPHLALWTARSKDEADALWPQLNALHPEVRHFTRRLERGQTARGYSIGVNEIVDFRIDWPEEGEPNWRETLRCPKTELSSRLRGCYHAYRTLRPDAADDRIYLTENATPFYRFVAERHRHVVGSEYLVDTPFGSTNAVGIRSEDLTALSFTDASFDVLMSFEVLEHVPDYRAAIAECARVVAPGGLALITAPFIPAAETLVRASIGADGAIVHHELPDYHGDPINPGGGILCYYWFGWSLLDELRQVGFRDVCVAYYASRQFGYLGPMQSVILAWK